MQDGTAAGGMEKLSVLRRLPWNYMQDISKAIQKSEVYKKSAKSVHKLEISKSAIKIAYLS